ncbi:MAG: hypothetical protein ABEJ74_04640 [Haloferacaceae archaeon]
MKTDSWAGSIEPMVSPESTGRDGHVDAAIDVRSTRMECPVCGAETTLAQVVAEGRCGGSLSGETDCDATLSLHLSARDGNG